MMADGRRKRGDRMSGGERLAMTEEEEGRLTPTYRKTAARAVVHRPVGARGSAHRGLVRESVYGFFGMEEGHRRGWEGGSGHGFGSVFGHGSRMNFNCRVMDAC